jgi:hypothetical protein
VIRLVEMTGQSAEMTIDWGKRVKRASAVDFELNALGDVPVRVVKGLIRCPIRPWQILTLTVET